MSKIIQHQANGRTFLIVEVPEDEHHYLATPNKLVCDFGNGDGTSIELPGSYTVFAESGKITGDQAEEMVEYFKGVGRYTCYDSDNHYCLESIPSFASLLRSHQISNAIILIETP